MSDPDENSKPSLKDRLKPHLPAFTIGLAAGVLITYVIRSSNPTMHIVVPTNEPGSVLLAPSLVKQVVQKGEAMFELVPGLHVDIIDWGNPNVADRS